MADSFPEMQHSQLAVTVAPLHAQVKEALRWIAQTDIRHVQLSATHPGSRPRDLDRSSRRGLLAALTRLELIINGIDAWIPQAHLLDPEKVSRAADALLAIIDLAADLGRCPVSVLLPEKHDDDGHARHVIESILHRSERQGVQVVDHALSADHGNLIGFGIDPAICLAAGREPDVIVNERGTKIESARLADVLTSGGRGPIGMAGESQLDVQAYKVALSIAGYELPVIIDARQWQSPAEGVLATAQRWRDA